MDADMLTEAGGAETSKQDRDAIVLADHSLTAVEDQRIADAINALDTLRSSGGSSYASSPTLQTPCSSEAFPFESEADFRDPAIGTADGQQHADSLFGRVSQFPIISGAYTLYERGKNSSGVVKYGTDLVESSVSAISRPVFNRLSPPPSPTVHTHKRSASQSSQHNTEGALVVHNAPTYSQEQRNRSAWHNVLVEAGGIGAAVSEESLKSLQYCLQWLAYATHSLQTQVSTLRNFIQSLSQKQHQRAILAPPLEANSKNQVMLAPVDEQEEQEMLQKIKSEVVDTVRKAVDVISAYAGAALPDQARNFVKATILSLPANWAKAVQKRSTPNGGVNGQASPLNATSSLSCTQEAAERILSFAVEGLDAMDQVTRVCNDTIDRADTWLERLRILGLSYQTTSRRKPEDGQTNEYANGTYGVPMEPEPRTPSPLHHRKTSNRHQSNSLGMDFD